MLAAPFSFTGVGIRLYHPDILIVASAARLWPDGRNCGLSET